MTNEIFWGNRTGGEGPSMYIYGGASIRCSVVEGGQASCGRITRLDWGYWMYESDPVFCDPENGDYHLAENTFFSSTHQPVCGQIGALPLACGPRTVSAGFSCTPSSGNLPFLTQMRATMTNICFDETRRIAARIDLHLANGGHISGWRRGFANVAASAALSMSWNQNIPALGSLVGDNHFTMLAVDVTPAPWNQPPHWPSGDSDSQAATVTGVAP